MLMFAHAGVLPLRINIDAMGALKIEAKRLVRSSLDYGGRRSIRNAATFAFHPSEGQADRPDCGVPRGGQDLDPTRLWRLALRPVCSAYGANIYLNRHYAYAETQV